MTLRRASAIGKRVRQVVAAPRTHAWAAALATSGLLLGAASSHAATHSTHTHHVATQSAGKAPAHAVHEAGAHAARETGVHSVRDTGSRSAHSSDKPSSRHGDHASASTHKPAPSSRHTAQPRHADDNKRTAKTHSGRRHHEEQYVDEPMPVHRAGNERRSRAEQEEMATNRARAAILAAIKTPAAERSAGKRGVQRPQPFNAHGPAQAYASAAAGISREDETEGLPLRGAVAGPASAAIGSASTESAPRTEVVEGFGAELGIHSAGKPAGSAAVVLPHESPAEQERDLRAAAEVASQPMFVPLYARDGNLLVPPPLKGSRDILVHQNQMADDAGLTRIQDDDELNRLRRAHLLVDFPESASLRVNEALPENRRAARPWTVQFATDAARAFYARFGEPLQVNSAVRTVAYQLRLQRTNGNAAAVDGEGASPHLTGQAIDFAKRGMSLAEIAWMRSYLMPLIDAGKIDVEEEFRQACFHVSVYASYLPAPGKHSGARTEVAQISGAAHTHTAAAPALEPDDNQR